MKQARAICAAMALGLLIGGCAHRAVELQTQPAVMDEAGLVAAGAAALRAGRDGDAAAHFSALAARNPRDGRRQTLAGLAYHGLGSRDPENLELALAGYDAALRAEPGAFWAAALAGRADFDRGRYHEATDHYARAVLMRPSDPRAMQALAGAALMSGDAELSAAAARRATALSPAPDAQSLRLLALSLAAAGDRSAAGAALDRLMIADPALGATTAARVGQLAQTEAVDAGPTPAPEPPEAPLQISVDVALVLSQNTRRDRTGVNLLDGLRLQYGYDRRSVTTETNGVTDLQRTITEAISVPQLLYNLNLFNAYGQSYQVVARPSLTAYQGETSEFFVGRSLKVAVAAVQTATLETIDIGTELKVTPSEITAKGAKLRVEIGRSFLSDEGPVAFREALTTFRQKVSATAEVRFGETLILSGLSETVDDRAHSKTPLIGDVPLLGLGFNQTNLNTRRDGVLILVTPSAPVSVEGRPWARPKSAARLAELWREVVDPSSDGAAVADRLRRIRVFSRMTAGDVRAPWPHPTKDQAEIVAAMLEASP